MAQSIGLANGTIGAATKLAQTLGVKPLDVIALAEEVARNAHAAKIRPDHIAQIRAFCGA